MTKNSTYEFQRFWNLYAVKRDKIAAEHAWKRLSAKDKKAAIAGISRYKQSCDRRGISYMYAEGYLRHHRWEDEEDEPQITPGKGVSSPTPLLPICDASGTRIGIGITEEELRAFDALKADMLHAWSRNRDDRNGMFLNKLLAGLELYGINDRRKVITLHSKGASFSRQHAVPWFWDPADFDALVSRHFNNYQWDCY